MDLKNCIKQPDEKTLITMALRGEIDAFNELVLMYQDMAYNHAYALLGDVALSEDATQESFIKAFQALGSFRDGSFRGWLLKIVTNSAYDLMRRSLRKPTQPLFPEDDHGEEIESASWLADPGTSVQNMVEQNELARDIYRLLDELPEFYRSVLTLIDLHELDYAEAAQALNVPIGTVKSRLARARLQMQKKLEGNLDYAGRLRSRNTCFAA